MPTAAQIEESNKRIVSQYPGGLVALFVGATSGVGEGAVREFARYGGKSRIYFIGRDKEAGERISKEMKEINPKGEYIFMSADLSLIRNVDEVCREIKQKEKYINCLFLCQGTLILRKETSEQLNYLMALTFFGRFRFIVNLLPLLRTAPGLRRVTTLMCGTKEGQIYHNDIQGRKGEMPISGAQGHMGTMMSLALGEVQKRAPEVSFAHVYPGFVDSKLIRGETGVLMNLVKYLFIVKNAVRSSHPRMTPKACGEVQTFVLTSARYPAAEKEENVDGVPLTAGENVAKGVYSEAAGGGVYSLDEMGNSAPARVDELLSDYRDDGIGEKLWKETETEFIRITGQAAI